jgi:Pyridoxamine 5'-phosphate oxidase
MPISEKLKALIRSAWDDGAPCLLATQGPNGPNISPKGSMVVFDDDHLAYWERSKKQALENLGHDKRVCVIYANFKAQRDGVSRFGVFAILWQGRIARERSHSRQHFQSSPATRANACRRGHWHSANPIALQNEPVIEFDRTHGSLNPGDKGATDQLLMFHLP